MSFILGYKDGDVNCIAYSTEVMNGNLKNSQPIYFTDDEIIIYHGDMCDFKTILRVFSNKESSLPINYRRKSFIIASVNMKTGVFRRMLNDADARIVLSVSDNHFALGYKSSELQTIYKYLKFRDRFVSLDDFASLANFAGRGVGNLSYDVLAVNSKRQCFKLFHHVYSDHDNDYDLIYYDFSPNKDAIELATGDVFENPLSSVKSKAECFDDGVFSINRKQLDVIIVRHPDVLPSLIKGFLM